MNEFKEKANKDSPDDRFLQTMSETEDLGIFQAYLAWVWRIAMIVGVLGGIGGLCFSAVAFFTVDKLNIRGLVMMPLLGAGLSGGMVVGTAILFAPTRFFSSKEGLVYLDEIGTRNIFGARLRILFLLLVGCAIGTMFVLGALQLAGFI